MRVSHRMRMSALAFPLYGHVTLHTNIDMDTNQVVRANGRCTCDAAH